MSDLAVATKPAGQSTDDLDLVAAVRAGDDRAFELLFLRYQSRIGAYVRGMVRDRERAEDITQEVFIAALRRLRATEAPIAFKPWIYEIAKNACIDAFRRSRNTSEVSFDADEGPGASMASSGGEPDAVVDAKLAIDNLCGAFGGLSRAHHDILVMREFEGRTYQEIGEQLGMSRAGVESTLFRARRRLSEEYEELVSGERCVRVRAIVDAPPGRAVGMRDQRRMARHVAHCQPCRRYARLAGADLGAARPSLPARVAALLPLPAFVRRRFDLDEAGQLLGQHTTPAALHWSTKAVAVLDPATVAGWPRAIATAATVAVAGLGAGAAVSNNTASKGSVSKDAAISETATPARALREHAPTWRAPGPAASRPAASRPAAESAPDRGGAPAKDATTTDAPGVRDKAPAPSRQPASATEPGKRPVTAPIVDAVTGVGATLPASPVEADDAPVADRPARTTPRKRRIAPLLDGVRDALGGDVDASAPGTLGDVVSTARDAIAPDAGSGDAAVDTGTAVGDGSTTSRPVATVVGQLLGGAGAGSP